MHAACSMGLYHHEPFEGMGCVQPVAVVGSMSSEFLPSRLQSMETTLMRAVALDAAKEPGVEMTTC